MNEKLINAMLKLMKYQNTPLKNIQAASQKEDMNYKISNIKKSPPRTKRLIG